MADALTPLLDAADVTASTDARMAAIQSLLESTCARPIPAPRWHALAAQITGELAQRARIEGRRPADIFATEVEAAIALAAPEALSAAARAFAEAYEVELRRRVANLVLDALLGEWRHDSEALDLDAEVSADDPLNAAHFDHLLHRLPDLAALTAAEQAALAGALNGNDPNGAHRASLHRARRKARNAVPEIFR